MPRVGIGMPRVGKGTGIADALFTSTQQRVLGLVFGQPERAFSVSELITLAGAGSGAVQRELKRLAASGLVSVQSVGGRKQYQANREAPVFEELRALVAKTVGVAEQIRAALAPASDQLRLAVLYGSVAKGSATAASDVDLLLVSDVITLEEVFALLEPLERRLGRPVSPTLYTSEELERRRRGHHPFLTKVLASEHVVLLGDIDELDTAR